MRFFFGLLLGAVLGVAGTTYFFSTGGGDYMMATSPRVSRLEQELRRVAAEREQVVKKLEEATRLIEQMSARFTDLERRFQTLEETGARVAPEPPASPDPQPSEPVREAP